MSNTARRTIIQIFMIVIGYMFGVIYQAHAAQRTILNAALNGGSYPWDTARADLNNNFDDCYVLVNNITVTGPVNLDTMDSLIDANVLQISEFVTLSGRPAHSTDLGTFTGTTIPDNSDNKEALQALETAVESGGGGAVDSVNGYTGVVVLDKADIGLANADNTADLAKPISTLTQTALDNIDQMVYPGAGIPLSTGSAWGTSYTLNALAVALGAENNTVSGDKTFTGSNDYGTPSAITLTNGSGLPYSSGHLDPPVISTTTTGATLNLDYSASKYHVVTFDQDCVVSVTNWPTTGTRGAIQIRTINAGAYTVTIGGKSLTLTASGTDMVILWTEDGGTTIYGGVALSGIQ